MNNSCKSIIFIFFIIAFASVNAFSWGGLKDNVQKELDSNPFLKSVGLKLKVVDDKNGYLTIDIYEGNRKIREKVHKGLDISQIENELLLGGSSSEEAKSITALKKSIDYVKKMEGVKEVLLTAQINTTMDQAIDLGDKAGKHCKEKKDDECYKLWRKSAELGNPHAQFVMGGLYIRGEGVQQDDKVAREWYLKAAIQGHSEAQYRLGSAYLFGDGVTENKKTAVEWFRKSAEQDNTDAQKALGYCYQSGRGVEQDYATAIAWFSKAAEKGDAQAQNYLALLYATCKDPKVQSGSQAVNYALKATSQKPSDLFFISTLAAAYARNGQFQDAIKAQEKSIALLQEAAKTNKSYNESLPIFTQRLNLYKNNQAYTEEATK